MKESISREYSSEVKRGSEIFSSISNTSPGWWCSATGRQCRAPHALELVLPAGNAEAAIEHLPSRVVALPYQVPGALAQRHGLAGRVRVQDARAVALDVLGQHRYALVQVDLAAGRL
jgi:hypothetical protein